jgi:NAD(P)-dependent dehydrogenase (short-subunit alcohol dehydrogenase family)
MVSKTLPYDPEVAYAQSKLANTMYANYLTDRLQGTGISVFGADPGSLYFYLEDEYLK